MFKKIKKAWKGEEKLWKVFWLWGAAIYLSVIPIGFLALGIHNICFNVATHIFAFFVGVAGFAFAFIYPGIFCISLWRCAKNTSKKKYFILARIFVPIYLILHIALATICFSGGSLLIVSSLKSERLSYRTSPPNSPCMNYFFK